MCVCVCVCVCVCMWVGVRMWSGFVNTAINRTPTKAGSGLTELTQSFDEGPVASWSQNAVPTCNSINK